LRSFVSLDGFEVHERPGEIGKRIDPAVNIVNSDEER
jgi:hypothetical protein